MNKLPYLYTEYGYYFMALHRQAMVYDPRNSDNPIIQEYFATYERSNNTLPIYHTVMEAELAKAKNIELPERPISYKMVMQDIHMAWVQIIHQMVFTEKAYNTFYCEYKDVIENILLYDSPTMKESLIYRYNGSGVSVFHIAAKIWIFNKCYRESDNGVITKEKVSKIMKDVLQCYGELENRISSEHCIVYMTDFNDVTLYDYLTNFVENYKENRYI